MPFFQQVRGQSLFIFPMDSSTSTETNQEKTIILIAHFLIDFGLCAFQPTNQQVHIFWGDIVVAVAIFLLENCAKMRQPPDY